MGDKRIEEFGRVWKHVRNFDNIFFSLSFYIFIFFTNVAFSKEKI